MLLLRLPRGCGRAGPGDKQDHLMRMLHLLWLRRRRQDPVLAGLPLVQRPLGHGMAVHVSLGACHCEFVQLPTCTSLEAGCVGH